MKLNVVYTEGWSSNKYRWKGEAQSSIYRRMELSRGAFTYDVSSRGGGGFKMLTVADKGRGGRGSKPC